MPCTKLVNNENVLNEEWYIEGQERLKIMSEDKIF